MTSHPSSFPCNDCVHGACTPKTVKYQSSELNYSGCVAKLLELVGFIKDGKVHCSCYRNNPDKHDAKFYKTAALKAPSMSNSKQEILEKSINDKAIVDEGESVVV